jgi:hypothetical protein
LYPFDFFGIAFASIVVIFAIEVEKMLKRILFLSLFLLVCFAPKAHCADLPNMCLRETIKAEKKYDIRQYLLSTIAVVESGRWDSETKEYVAWPWTINANGVGMFFSTKAEAIAKTKQLLKNGVESIDVGCMQINLKYHGKEFSSLEEAFTPAVNVAYAAKFLNRLYGETGQWLQAATSYHSKLSHKAVKYEKKLVSVFSRIYNDAQNGKSLVSHDKTVAFNKYIHPVSHKDNVEDAQDAEAKAFAMQWRKRRIEAYLKRKAKQKVLSISNG